MESWMFNVEMGRDNTAVGCEQLAENSFAKYANSNDTMKRKYRSVSKNLGHLWTNATMVRNRQVTAIAYSQAMHEVKT